MVKTMRPVDLMSVCIRMRDADQRCFCLTDDDPQVWAAKQALRPGLAWTIFSDGGLPMACFGFRDEIPGVATVWLVAVEGAQRHLKTGTRVFREALKAGIYRRVQAYVNPESAASVAFITRWMGFTLDGSLPRMAANGEPLNLYSLVPGGV